MVTHQEIERQLKAIGAKFTWWGRGEARELEHIIMPGEKIMYAINGRYEGGFAMLCITDQRAVLIDKKPLYLTLEDIRYDMISELDFSQRLLDATITIISLNKTLQFTALKINTLRQATSYLQARVLELRQTVVSPVTTSLQKMISGTGEPQVNSLTHRVTNPYTKVPLMMRRRVSRYF